MAQIDMRDDQYAHRLKDGDTVWCVDAFALVGEAQRLGMEADKPLTREQTVDLARKVVRSEPDGAPLDDAKAFAIVMRVFRYMESLGNA